MQPFLFYIARLLLAVTLLITACKQDPAEPTGQGNLRIEFENVVGAENLQLNDRTYTNALGQSYTVSQFKYYVSNFTLTKKDGSTYQVPESYFLIDEENAASRTITLPDIPAGDYAGLSFVIGVDSTRNTSGAQTGALDPVNGMFWSWNTGYIFVRLEGNAPASPQPYNKLQYHIGGFKGATNCIRTVSPALNGNTLRIRAGKNPEVHYLVNAATLFTGATPVDFSQPGMTAIHGGANAVKLANNYQQELFTFDHLHNDE
jgi:hypothetical protein